MPLNPHFVKNKSVCSLSVPHKEKALAEYSVSASFSGSGTQD